MENPGRPRRRRPAQMIGWMLTASVLLCHAEPAANLPNLQVNYPPATNGKAAESRAVPMNGAPLLVAVVTPGANASHPSVLMGNQKITARTIGYDPVSSLAFLNIEGTAAQSARWRENADAIVGLPLKAQTSNGPINCRATGWIKQVGTKILPFALLQIAFDGPVPPAGTPLLDPEGGIAAIVFQASGNGNTGFAIPAEAVHRVRKDLTNGGKLIRGYLGLSLRAEGKSPLIVNVLPDSPAAAAGIKPGDLLLHVGNRRISDYPDAANAFFYLIPGQPVRLKLLRGGKEIDYSLTPTPAPAK